jgi:hypothetical protein
VTHTQDFLSFEDHLEAIGWLRHEPHAPYPRSDVIGEQVYAERWKELMHAPVPDNECDWAYKSLPNTRLQVMMWLHPEPLSQRHATLCANFVTWLGSNCGSSFLSSAMRLARTSAGSTRRPYRMQWANENAREHGINNGIRIIEHLLADDSYRDPKTRLIKRLPQATGGDYETIDLLLMWMERQAGQQFLHACGREIGQRYNAQKRARQLR